MTDDLVDRVAVADDLERARTEFHRILASMRDDDWDTPSVGTRWTNEELLYHIVFGYMVVQRLLLLVWVFGRLPDGFSRVFARMLNAATTPFDVINYYGSRLGARVYNRRRMGAKLDRVIDSLRRSLARGRGSDFRRGMHFPTPYIHGRTLVQSSATAPIAAIRPARHGRCLPIPRYFLRSSVADHQNRAIRVAQDRMAIRSDEFGDVLTVGPAYHS